MKYTTEILLVRVHQLSCPYCYLNICIAECKLTNYPKNAKKNLKILMQIEDFYCKVQHHKPKNML